MSKTYAPYIRRKNADCPGMCCKCGTVIYVEMAVVIWITPQGIQVAAHEECYK